MSKLSSGARFSYNTLINKLDLYDLLFKRLPELYRPTDALLHMIVLGALVAAAGLWLINLCTDHFTLLVIPAGFYTAIPGVFIVWILGTLLYARSPRFGLFLSSLAQMYFFLIVGAIVISALLTTPFPIIDHHLLAFDRALGFSTLGLLAFTHHHTWLTEILRHTYDCWFFELTLTPLVLSWFNRRNEIDRYILATFVSFIVAGTIYFFWPTIAPAGILHSHFFAQDQHDLVKRFYEIHHSLPVTVFDGGVIAFPSCHVINSLIVLYTFRRYKIIFYPLLIINVFLISATMALGYHYLADVFAGALIAYLSIKAAHVMLSRREAKSTR